MGKIKNVGNVASRCSLDSANERGILARPEITSKANSVSVQRYRKDLLPVERKRRLDAIGFVWDWLEYRWEQNFAVLLKFKKREGHCRVPIPHKEGGVELGYWVSTQRRNRDEMSAERRKWLNKIGFVWNAAMGRGSWRHGRRHCS